MYTIFGGELRGPLELSIVGQLPVSAEQCLGNIDHARSLALPTLRLGEAAHKRLVVVGGGPSAKLHLKTFRDFDGTVDIWAINGMWKWLKDNGVNSTFLAIDPHPIVNQWIQGCEKALLANVCDPMVFETMQGKDVTVFEIGEGQIRSGSSTATCCPDLAFKMGYRSVTFYGCESCYVPNGSHAYMHEPREEELLVECGGGFYLTAPDFYMQAGELSDCIKAIPEYLREESGGLLRAMIENDTHAIRWVSDGMVKTMSNL